MKLSELKEQIIGKRVACIHNNGENRQGTILALVTSGHTS